MARNRWLATLLLVPLLQCRESVTGPGIPEDIAAKAIRLRIDVKARTVTQIGVPPNPAVSFPFVGSGVNAATTNTTTAPLGKNKTLIRFDIALTNSLSDVRLVAPTSPAPPAGTTGLLLIAFQATAVSGSGSIVPSSDWDGSPFAA